MISDFLYILSQTEKDFQRNSCMNTLGEAIVLSGVEAHSNSAGEFRLQHAEARCIQHLYF